VNPSTGKVVPGTFPGKAPNLSDGWRDRARARSMQGYAPHRRLARCLRRLALCRNGHSAISPGRMMSAGPAWHYDCVRLYGPWPRGAAKGASARPNFAENFGTTVFRRTDSAHGPGHASTTSPPRQWSANGGALGSPDPHDPGEPGSSDRTSFSASVQRHRLPEARLPGRCKATFERGRDAGTRRSPTRSAQAMKEWAMEKGANPLHALGSSR